MRTDRHKNWRRGVSEPGPLSVLPLSRGTVCLRFCGSPNPKNRSRDSLRLTYLTADYNGTFFFFFFLSLNFSNFQAHRACYNNNSMEWLRSTSAHHHHHHHIIYSVNGINIISQWMHRSKPEVKQQRIPPRWRSSNTTPPPPSHSCCLQWHVFVCWHYHGLGFQVTEKALRENPKALGVPIKCSWARVNTGQVARVYLFIDLLKALALSTAQGHLRAFH